VIPFDISAYDSKIDPNDSILSIAERLAKCGCGGTDYLLPLVAANQKHAKRKFAGIILAADIERWVGTGLDGSTGEIAALEAFLANHRRFNKPQSGSPWLGSLPKLVNVDLPPYPPISMKKPFRGSGCISKN